MRLRIFLLISFLIILTSSKAADIKEINLDYGFKISIGQEEVFGKLTIYSSFKLIKNGRAIYIDSLNEYEFGNELYPIVMKTGINSYELLFEINNRPSKNYLKRLYVKNDSVYNVDKLPTFVGKPKDIDNDGILEYAGFWDNAQVWGDDNNITAYNPILYYELKTNGLVLDRPLTIQKNKTIYGNFHGFIFSEEIPQSVICLSLFQKEIDNLKTR